VTGSNSFNRLAQIGRFYQPLQKAVTRDWEGYTDAQLKLLLMMQCYNTMLGVIDDLKASLEKPKGKEGGAGLERDYSRIVILLCCFVCA